jgi:hypothetical protein
MQERTRDFVHDESLKCDQCNGVRDPFNASPFKFLDPNGEVENRLAKKFLSYDACNHHICFHCIENASVGHSLKIKEIECPKCTKDKEAQKQQVWKEKDELKMKTDSEYATNFRKQQDEFIMMNMNIHRILSKASGFPII